LVVVLPLSAYTAYRSYQEHQSAAVFRGEQEASWSRIREALAEKRPVDDTDRSSIGILTTLEKEALKDSEWFLWATGFLLALPILAWLIFEAVMWIWTGQRPKGSFGGPPEPPVLG
jgi:hypothetical protein